MDIYLIVIFGKNISLIACHHLPENGFIFGERTFVDTGINTFVGFYDWLRTKQDTVIGVRINFYSDELNFLKNELLTIPYLTNINEWNAIDIFFSDYRNIDQEKSNDQDFLDNKIYKSNDGTYAVSFDARYAIESLKDNEQITLISLE